MTVPSLRPQVLGDLALLAEEADDPGFDDFGPSSPPSQVREPDLDGRGAMTVIDESGEVAGSVSWIRRDWGPNAGSRCVMIGIWLRPGHRGRGIGRVVQRQLAELFFTHTTLNRVEAHTDVENVAEQRALQAAGFTREGVTRGAQWRGGAYHDGVLYAVLRSDLQVAI